MKNLVICQRYMAPKAATIIFFSHFTFHSSPVECKQKLKISIEFPAIIDLQF